MPPRTEAGTPEGHSLALFSDDHPARHEVDRALALVADPGAAGDIHRFRLSMRRKQDLFARMRDLDIAWNDWLAEAEGIDSRIRASNITSRIYPYLPQPLPRGLDVYHITELHSNDRRFRAHMDHLDGLAPLPVPPPHARESTVTLRASRDRHYMTKKFGGLYVSTAAEGIQRGNVHDRMFCAENIRHVVTSLFITLGSERRVRLAPCILPVLNLMIELTQTEYDV
ncbi:hypothetical protein EDB87DRAFT_1578758 [Lactarius vividus]|nr:hypothetical protein EDB87DRAFT_1578758 [Lactarius vividus]